METELAIIQFHTWKIFLFFLLLLLANVFLAVDIARAADTETPETNIPEKQTRHPIQVTDGRHTQTSPVPSGITLGANLIQDIDYKHALLESEAPRIEQQLAKFKQIGHLDRRTKRDLVGSLHEAHAIMSYLRQMLRSGKLGKWQARDMAQDLNYQSDVLDASLEVWGDKLSVSGDNADQITAGEEKVRQEQRRLVQTLSDISRMLRNTGKEIVRQAH